MATNLFYAKTLYPLQDRVLRVIDGLKTPFYLTGGTALSRCYFGHRYSDDLDLFLNKNSKFQEYGEQIVSALSERFEVKINLRSTDYCNIRVDDLLKLEMVNDIAFYSGENRLFPIFSRVDNVTNILSNKLSAIVGRDEPKDVVDIVTIAKNQKVDWEKIFQDASYKSAGVFPPSVAKRLSEFPLEFLERIKWVKKPKLSEFERDLNNTIEMILKG